MSDHGPAVPSGPGVVPPFPAPPAEGGGKRVWFGVGAAAIVAALCCGGGLAASIGLVVSAGAALGERADAAVEPYLAAVRDQRYDEAYGLLCDDARDAETPGEFAERLQDEKRIRSYTVGEVNLTELVVPVDVVYTDGGQASLDIYLDQDASTGDFEVCSVE